MLCSLATIYTLGLFLVTLRRTDLTSDLSEAPDLTASVQVIHMRPSGPHVTQPLLSPSSSIP